VLRLASETEDRARGFWLGSLGESPSCTGGGRALHEGLDGHGSLLTARWANRSPGPTLARIISGEARKAARRNLLGPRWRMLAANELKRSSLSTSAVAERVGYQSKRRSRVAFKGQHGASRPAQWSQKSRSRPGGDPSFATPTGVKHRPEKRLISGAVRKQGPKANHPQCHGNESPGDVGP